MVGTSLCSRSSCLFPAHLECMGCASGEHALRCTASAAEQWDASAAPSVPVRLRCAGRVSDLRASRRTASAAEGSQAHILTLTWTLIRFPHHSFFIPFLRRLHGGISSFCYDGVNVPKSNNLPNGNNANLCASNSRDWCAQPGTHEVAGLTRVKRAKDDRG